MSYFLREIGNTIVRIAESGEFGFYTIMCGVTFVNKLEARDVIVICFRFLLTTQHAASSFLTTSFTLTTRHILLHEL